MSGGLIKASSATAELLLSAQVSANEMLADPRGHAAEPDPLAGEIDRLESLLDARDEIIAKHAAALAAARAEGETVGREAAEAAFEEERAEALERLESGLGEAQAELRQALVQTGDLALLVARQALERLFGDPNARAETVVALIAHQLAQMEREAVLAVEVSRVDFPDTREIASLAERLGLPPGSLKAPLELGAGACRMRLRLGTLELGIDRQWATVRALLDEYLDQPDATQ